MQKEIRLVTIPQTLTRKEAAELCGITVAGIDVARRADNVDWGYPDMKGASGTKRWNGKTVLIINNRKFKMYAGIAGKPYNYSLK